MWSFNPTLGKCSKLQQQCSAKEGQLASIFIFVEQI